MSYLLNREKFVILGASILIFFFAWPDHRSVGQSISDSLGTTKVDESRTSGFAYLLEQINPNPYENQPTTDDDILFTALKFEETQREAVEEIVYRMESDVRIALRAKSFLKKELDSNGLYSASLDTDIKPLIVGLLEHEQTFDLAADTFLTVPFLTDQLDVILFAKIGKSEKHKAAVMELLNDGGITSDITSQWTDEWLAHQLGPETNPDPVPNWIKHLDSEDQELSSNAQQTLANVALDVKYFESISKFFGSSNHVLVGCLSASISNSGKKHLANVRRLLNSDDAQTQANAIICLGEMDADDIETQNAVAKIFHQTKSVALRLWALRYFTIIRCQVQSVNSAARKILNNPESDDQLYFAIKVFAKQRLFDSKTIRLAAKHISHEKLSIAREAFTYINSGGKTPDYMLPDVLNQLEQRPFLQHFAGVPFYQDGGGPKFWILNFGKPAVPKLTQLLQNTPNQEFGFEYANLILQIDPQNQTALAFLEKSIDPKNHESRFRVRNTSDENARWQASLDAIELYAKHQSDRKRLSEVLHPVLITVLKNLPADFSHEPQILEFYERHEIKSPLTVTEVRNIFCNTNLKVDAEGSKPKWISPAHRRLAFRLIRRCESVTGADRKWLTEQLENAPKDITLLQTLAILGERKAIPWLQDLLVYDCPIDPVMYFGGIVGRPSFDGHQECTMNGLAAVWLTRFDDLDQEMTTADIADRWDNERINQFDHIAFSVLLLKSNGEDVKARKTIIDSLSSDNASECHYAAYSCGILGAHATFAIKKLEELKFDYYPEVRSAAIKALQIIDDETP